MTSGESRISLPSFHFTPGTVFFEEIPVGGKFAHGQSIGVKLNKGDGRVADVDYGDFEGKGKLRLLAEVYPL